MLTGIDATDKQIIDLLAGNARLTSSDLGKKLNISSSTVRRRIKKLVEQGIIRIYAVPEPTKIGVHTEAVVSLNVLHEHISHVVQKLSTFEQVRWLVITSGRFDIMIYVWCSSTNALYEFIENIIGRLPGVKSSETFICLRVVRRIGQSEI